MMSEAQDAPELASNRPQSVPKRRRRLRFRVGDRGEPLGFLNLDKALDQLGWKLFAKKWEEMLLIPQFPLQYERRRKRFCHYETGHDPAWELRLTRVIPRTLTRRRTLRQADRIYKHVRRELKHAIEAGQIEAYLVARDGRILPLPTRGALSVQMRRMFYTGTFRLELDGAAANCRVLLGGDQFTKWLVGDRQTSSPVDDQSQSRWAQFVPLLKTAARRAREQSYVFTKTDFETLLRRGVAGDETVGVPLSEEGFKRLWGHEALSGVRQAAGRRTDAMKKKFDEDRSDLIKLLIEEFVARRQQSLPILADSKLPDGSQTT